MAQQTALQGFVEALTSNGYVIINQTLIDTYLAMEKEQIKQAYKFGLQDEYVIGSEQYYNEIYDK